MNDSMQSSSNPFLFEVCANSVASCIAAQEGGAHRVELCDNLYEGGTTPSAACIQFARNHLTIGLHVLIRPRGGDFLYSDREYKVMKRDIEIAKDSGADGVVIGILGEKGTVDKKRTIELVELADPLSVTFHRAFDVTSDPFKAFEDIIETGCRRILTSGQANKAIEGVDTIAELVERAGDRITILVGSGVNEDNIAEMIQKTHAWEFHGSALKRIPSAMQYRHPHITIGGIPQIPEFEIAVTDSERVRNLIALGKKTWDSITQRHE